MEQDNRKCFWLLIVIVAAILAVLTGVTIFLWSEGIISPGLETLGDPVGGPDWVATLKK